MVFVLDLYFNSGNVGDLSKNITLDVGVETKIVSFSLQKVVPDEANKQRNRNVSARINCSLFIVLNGVLSALYFVIPQSCKYSRKTSVFD